MIRKVKVALTAFVIRWSDGPIHEIDLTPWREWVGPDIWVEAWNRERP